MDKLEREEPARSQERLERECALSASRALEVMALFDGPGLEKVVALHGDDPGVAESVAGLEEYVRILSSLGLGDFVQFDLRIVRGLAYYTGIVFELFDRQGELRAICGGGRYDRLLELVGGDPLPAVGFGMGDVVLVELLGERGLLPPTQREVDLFLVAIVPELRPKLLELARVHRAKGRRVVYSLRHQSVRKQFSAAASEGARSVVILGPSEVERGVALVRDMKTGGESEVPLKVLETGEEWDGDEA